MDLNSTDAQPEKRSSTLLTRRNVVKTAAWSVPAVTVLSAVPAFAASFPTGSGKEAPVLYGQWAASNGTETGQVTSTPGGGGGYVRLKFAVLNYAAGSAARTLNLSVTITPPATTGYTLSTTASGASGAQDIRRSGVAGNAPAITGQTSLAAPGDWGTTGQSLGPAGTQIVLSTGNISLATGYMPFKLDIIGTSPSTTTKPTSVSFTATVDGQVLGTKAVALA